MWLEVLLFLGVLWIIYKQWTNTYSYWEKKGFPYVKGSFPLGSQPNNVLSTNYIGDVFQQLYKKLDPYPIGGFYFGRKCELLLRDPKLIKKILVKDFNNFRARNDFAPRGIIGKHLFGIEGDLWRTLRVKLTPTFTSGKLKGMFYLFRECADNMDQHFKEMADNGEEIEVKDWMARFTTDIISTCAFGLEANSLDKPDNELRKLGQSIFIPRVRLRLRILRFLVSMVPSITKFMQFDVFPKKIESTLYKIIGDTVDFRKKNNVTRNDFLDLLIKIKNSDDLDVEKRKNENGVEEKLDLKMDLHLMVAQCFVFFAAGFETSSSVQANCLYELAMNPDIQEKLRNEIDQVLKQHNGEITYQALQEMTYLEQVINETMRKYPTLPILTRVCTKEYKIPETNLVIEKGIRINIPVCGLHHDPQYYPEPEKFLPDRFSPENEGSIPPFAFLPFGEGPRICIGMRFGLLQTKTGIVTTLSKYKLIKSENTPKRLSFLPTGLISTVKEKITMKIAHREK